MTRPIRNNQPQAHLRAPESLQGYAAEKLRIPLNPDKPVRLDDELRVQVDAAAVVMRSVEAYAPGQSARLRAIVREMLAAQVEIESRILTTNTDRRGGFT